MLTATLLTIVPPGPPQRDEVQARLRVPSRLRQRFQQLGKPAQEPGSCDRVGVIPGTDDVAVPDRDNHRIPDREWLARCGHLAVKLVFGDDDFRVSSLVDRYICQAAVSPDR